MRAAQSEVVDDWADLSRYALLNPASVTDFGDVLAYSIVLTDDGPKQQFSVICDLDSIATDSAVTEPVFVHDKADERLELALHEDGPGSTAEPTNANVELDQDWEEWEYLTGDVLDIHFSPGEYTEARPGNLELEIELRENESVGSVGAKIDARVTAGREHCKESEHADDPLLEEYCSADSVVWTGYRNDTVDVIQNWSPDDDEHEEDWPNQTSRRDLIDDIFGRSTSSASRAADATTIISGFARHFFRVESRSSRTAKETGEFSLLSVAEADFEDCRDGSQHAGDFGLLDVQVEAEWGSLRLPFGGWFNETDRECRFEYTMPCYSD